MRRESQGAVKASYRAGAPGYSKDLAHGTIGEIRTDLDAFSDAEDAVLENHGYLLADVAVSIHAPELLPERPPAPSPPRSDWLDRNEDEVRAALAKSAKRRLLGSWRRR